MKKSIIAIAALLAIAAACTKEDAQISNTEFNGNAPVFTASVGTKAELSGTKVNWVAGDHLAVWNGSAKADYSTTGSGATADFTTSDSFASASEYVALYPFSAGASCTSGTVTTELPAAQTATAAGFDPAAHLAVATTTSTTLSFKNAVAYLKFTVPTGMDDLTSVSFSGNSSEKVAGACTINASTGALTATGSATATLSGTFTEGADYFIAIAPQEFASGYTVAIERTSGNYNMVSSKDVTFTRSEARNIGELWDGAPVVLMEGTALASATEMTKISKPANISNVDDVYTFRGALSGGQLTVREKYSGTTVASNITIPYDGNYHVMYNKSTGRFRVYSQDIMTHFGNTVANSPAQPEVFTLNNFTDNTSSPLDLSDYNGNATGVTMSVDVSAISGLATMNYKYSNIRGGGAASYSPWVNDDFYPANGWGTSWSLPNTNKQVNSNDIVFTIAGLDNDATYDVRIMASRYGSSPNLRCASFTIGGTEIIVDCAVANKGTYDLSEFKQVIANFDSISPSSTNIEMSMHSITKHRDAQNDDFCEGFISFLYISKVVYSQN